MPGARWEPVSKAQTSFGGSVVFAVRRGTEAELQVRFLGIPGVLTPSTSSTVRLDVIVTTDGIGPIGTPRTGVVLGSRITLPSRTLPRLVGRPVS